MAELRLRQWRVRDVGDLAVMADDDYLHHWSRSVVLDIEDDNAASMRLADRLGAERRQPSRVKVDRTGTPRMLVVHVLRI